jgi:hypothetical protein
MKWLDKCLKARSVRLDSFYSELDIQQACHASTRHVLINSQQQKSASCSREIEIEISLEDESNMQQTCFHGNRKRGIQFRQMNDADDACNGNLERIDATFI